MIVIDEFATLANEVPEFVEGVVDVAQRGRTLGLHLVLATQRPGGVVTENIRANTNLRIALRMSDPAESQDVIGVPDAAPIPRSLPGRAYAVTGHGELTEFQTAYVGGLRRRARPIAESWSQTSASQPSAGLRRQPAVLDTASDLHQLVEAARGAAAELRIPARARRGCLRCPIVPLRRSRTSTPTRGPRSGWSTSPRSSGSVRSVRPGTRRQPARLRHLRQRQDDAAADAGGLARADATPEELHVYGLDFATRGLDPLQTLPHCGGVITGEDEERVARLFALARKTIAERKELLGRGNSTASPRILILLDGYAAFAAAYERVDAGELVDALPRLVSDGRPLGVHFAVAAERRGAVRPALTSVIQNGWCCGWPTTTNTRRSASSRGRSGGYAPGWSRLRGRSEMQCALVGADPGSEPAAVAAAGERMREHYGDASAPPIRLLPAEVPRGEMPAPEQPLEAVIGLSDESLAPVSTDSTKATSSCRPAPVRAVDCARDDRPLSPRSDAFARAAPRRSEAQPPAVIGDLVVCRAGLQESEALLSSLAERVAARTSGSEEPIVLVVDDGGELSDGKAGTALETIARRGRDLGVWVVAATEAQGAHRTFGGWLRELRNEEHGLLLVPQVDIDGDLLGVRLPRRSATTFPPGRGYLVQRGRIELIQVAAG